VEAHSRIFGGSAFFEDGIDGIRVAHIPNAIAVAVLLMAIGVRGAIVLVIADAVTVTVRDGFADLRICRPRKKYDQCEYTEHAKPPGPCDPKRSSLHDYLRPKFSP